MSDIHIEPTAIEGVLVVRGRPAADARGHFVRLWCRDAFAAAGLAFVPAQISASFNHRRGTLRGLHWQDGPDAETKLVRASRGRIFDVAVDLRPGSPTRRAWVGLELDAAQATSLLIPPGCAHGFLTLTDGAEVTYAIDSPYRAGSGRGARFDDPVLAIAWPGPPAVISDRDLSWPVLDDG